MTVQLNVVLKDEDAKRWNAEKERFGVKSNAELVRILLTSTLKDGALVKIEGKNDSLYEEAPVTFICPNCEYEVARINYGTISIKKEES